MNAIQFQTESSPPALRTSSISTQQALDQSLRDGVGEERVCPHTEVATVAGFQVVLVRAASAQVRDGTREPRPFRAPDTAGAITIVVACRCNGGPAVGRQREAGWSS